MNTKIRKLLTYNRIHQLKVDVEKPYVPRSERGRVLIQLEMNFKTIAVGLHKYLSKTNDWMLQLVLFYNFKAE